MKMKQTKINKMLAELKDIGVTYESLKAFEMRAFNVNMEYEDFYYIEWNKVNPNIGIVYASNGLFVTTIIKKEEV